MDDHAFIQALIYAFVTLKVIGKYFNITLCYVLKQAVSPRMRFSSFINQSPPLPSPPPPPLPH
jgi:hypothetical protein